MTWERTVIIAVVAVAAAGLVCWLTGELLDIRDRRRRRRRGHAAARHAKRDELRKAA